MAIDILDEAQPFLAQCGPCDAGLPMPCSHPTADYRPVMARLVAEVERLRSTAPIAELAIAYIAEPDESPLVPDLYFEMKAAVRHMRAVDAREATA